MIIERGEHDMNRNSEAEASTHFAIIKIIDEGQEQEDVLNSPSPRPTSWVSPTKTIPMRLRPTGASCDISKIAHCSTTKVLPNPVSPNNSKHQPARESVPTVPIRRDLRSNCPFPGWQLLLGTSSNASRRKTKNQSAGEDPTPLSVCPKRATSTPQKKKKESFANPNTPGNRTTGPCLVTPAASVPNQRPGLAHNGRKKKKKIAPSIKRFWLRAYSNGQQMSWARGTNFKWKRTHFLAGRLKCSCM